MPFIDVKTSCELNGDKIEKLNPTSEKLLL